MKWKSFTLAAVIASVMVACGSNSSDKETATHDITDTTVVDTSTLTVIDSTAIILAEVPAKTKASFEKKYPKATNVKWGNHKPDKEKIDWELSGWPEMDEQDHKVWFHWQGSEHESRYNKSGDWVGTTNVITSPASLPAAVTKAIRSQYDGYAIRYVTREDDKDRSAYEVILEKGTDKVRALIGENGEVLKKKKM
ncbi:MAG TPA: PepSY-like domain-containing protein [Chitinophagaceae bacterium]|nr:PepSY-like domain-containing protein [Chitinophagaceae bacterium]